MHTLRTSAFLSLLVALLPQDPKPAPAAPGAPAYSTTALAKGCEYSDPMTLRAPVDLLRGHPSRAGADLIHAVVEIPAGATDKWEVKADGVMRWDVKDGKPRVVKYLGYPANYGIVPRTLLGKEIGGDGDPLDVLVLGASLPRGTAVAVRVLGTIRLVDAGDKDDKIVAVVPDSPLGAADSIAALDAAYPGITAILKAWFENYKGPGALQCGGFGPRDEAQQLLAAAEASFTAAEAARK